MFSQKHNSEVYTFFFLSFFFFFFFFLRTSNLLNYSFNCNPKQFQTDDQHIFKTMYVSVSTYGHFTILLWEATLLYCYLFFLFIFFLMSTFQFELFTINVQTTLLCILFFFLSFFFYCCCTLEFNNLYLSYRSRWQNGATFLKIKKISHMHPL